MEFVFFIAAVCVSDLLNARFFTSKFKMFVVLFKLEFGNHRNYISVITHTVFSLLGIHALINRFQLDFGELGYLTVIHKTKYRRIHLLGLQRKFTCC